MTREARSHHSDRFLAKPSRYFHHSLSELSNLLLRTLPAVHQELDPSLNDSATISIDFGDLPRPKRSTSTAEPNKSATLALETVTS